MSETNDTPDKDTNLAKNEAAVRRAVREAVLTHARLGRSIVGWKDGALVWLTPEELLAASTTWREPTVRPVPPFPGSHAERGAWEPGKASRTA